MTVIVGNSPKMQEALPFSYDPQILRSAGVLIAIRLKLVGSTAVKYYSSQLVASVSVAADPGAR